MKSGQMDHSVVINERAREPVAQLCANLYLHGEGLGPKVLAITSADPGEGRSSLAIALGLQVMETLGGSTLVMEANFRRPGMAKLAGLSKDAAGLAEVLYKGRKVDEVVQSLGPNQPDIMTAGQIESGPFSPLMSREKIEKVIQDLSKRYQYIIMETPPINQYPETLLLSALADGVILAIRAGVTSRETVSLATKRLEAAGGNFYGLVLNQKQYPLPNWLYKRL
jgi:capsular exopolysaccharide synthesis family protein